MKWRTMAWHRLREWAGLAPQPLMYRDEVRELEALLTTRSRRQTLQVLEYGAGGSTVHFPSLLQSRNIPFEWIAIESDPLWAERVRMLLDRHRLACVCVHDAEILEVDVALLNRSRYRRSLLEQGVRVPYEEYTELPKRWGRAFDVVIVDGRDRKNCVKVGLEILTPGGFIVLHDAHRPYYQCLLEQYPHGRFLGPRLWVVTRE